MAVKLQLLVAAALVNSAFAVNARNLRRSALPGEDYIPTAAEVAALSEDAMKLVEHENSEGKQAPKVPTEDLKAAVTPKVEEPVAATPVEVVKAPAKTVSPKVQDAGTAKSATANFALKTMEASENGSQKSLKTAAAAAAEQVNSEAAAALKTALDDEEQAERAALKDEEPTPEAPAQKDILPGKKTLVSSAMEKDVTNIVRGLQKSGTMTKAIESTIKSLKDMIENEMMPRVTNAHKLDVEHLEKLSSDLSKCTATKESQLDSAKGSKEKYDENSPLHKSCRQGEGGLLTEYNACKEEIADKESIKKLHCKAFAMVEKKFSNQASNVQIVTHAGSEATETYVKRISATFCHGGDIGSGCGFECKFMKAKKACDDAVKAHERLVNKCSVRKENYEVKKTQCDHLQDAMDGAACRFAVDTKDACETYAECYTSRKESYETSQKVVEKEEADRKAEWRGLQRMWCLVNSCLTNTVTEENIKWCNDQEHDTNWLTITYPSVGNLEGCHVPDKYPATAAYKKAEFADLPIIAKGKQDITECTGVMEVSTEPAAGSPDTCKCNRVTMNGPYSAGPLVKCTGCLDVKMTTEKNSCPDGTKLFSPRNRDDWQIFLNSASALADPHFIIDVTRPENGCDGCTSFAMNSDVKQTRHQLWQTSDGSPWWLQSKASNQPDGDYQQNCYLNLMNSPWASPDAIEFDDANCGYHSKSYYCQPKQLSVTPKSGSPRGCSCKKVELTGHFSPGALVRCDGCLDVRRTTQKNSCPKGTKIFAPRTRRDWITIIASVEPLRDPNWIIDVTRPQDGCGGCTGHSMNSDDRTQATWRTSDGAAWWLRDHMHSSPTEDYTANCYMNLKNPVNENTLDFENSNCAFHSSSYYCQTSNV